MIDLSRPVKNHFPIEDQILSLFMRTHTGDKLYQCTVCGKSFSDKSNLIRHMCMHAGLKPFTCTTCKLSFSQKQNLTSHMRKEMQVF